MKKIAVLFIALLFIGCTQNAIYVVRLSPPDMVEQFKLKQIDGYVAWEPFVSKGAKYGKVLLTSHEIWSNHPCCVVASGDINESALNAVVWAHIKATSFIKNPENREKVVEYASEFTGLERDVVENALKNIKFTTYPDEKAFRKYFKFLRDKGLVRDVNTIGFENEDEFFSNFLRKDVYEEAMKMVEMNQTPRTSEHIRIGYLTADLHQLALYIAVKEGYLDQTGLRYELKQYKNGVAVMDAFRVNEIDVAYLGGAPATLKRINDNTKIRIVAGANNEGSAIVVQDYINSVEDLKGRKIAIPGYGTVQDFLLRIVAEEHGLKVVSK
ncbi:hypothetical protein Asulf_00359 [Archaeoglobus sulfaticallidus PM70-1]|uniref:ABC-type nitrate/sulfonate/bicarbonate transport systems, periplasmic component n=1 Tax=Archaeoglobus sulfaticallidus PM70-1 TaxID=387631 RepID=N0BBK3_9EURY|nr:ABC transporter substrate-binding protein [Archaeoglobus sulfaticallidus]AGK60388.1 hypothetical protein Asulf_00359 [Archaeoglobus sulfaticallidus PM70-1]